MLDQTQRDRPVGEIEVTPGMAKAGARVLEEWKWSETLEPYVLAQDVYRAMVALAPWQAQDQTVPEK